MKIFNVFLIGMLIGCAGVSCPMDQGALERRLFSDASYSDDSGAGDEGDTKQQKQDYAEVSNKNSAYAKWSRHKLVSTSDPGKDRKVQGQRTLIAMTTSSKGSVARILRRLTKPEALQMGLKSVPWYDPMDVLSPATDCYLQTVEYDEDGKVKQESMKVLPTQQGNISIFAALPNASIWRGGFFNIAIYPVDGRNVHYVGRGGPGFIGCSKVESLAALPNNHIAVGYANGDIEIWNAQTYKRIEELLTGDSDEPEPCIALAPVGTSGALAACFKSNDSPLRVYRKKGQEWLRLKTVSNTEWTRIKATQDGSKIISVDDTGRVSLWNSETGACLLNSNVQDRGLDYIDGLQLDTHKTNSNGGQDVCISDSIAPIGNNGMVAVVNRGSLQQVDLGTAEAIEHDEALTNYNIRAVASTEQGELITAENARTVTLWKRSKSDDGDAKKQSDQEENV